VFTGLTEGSYTAYVQDANLCIDSIVVDVFAPPALTLTIDSTNITCKDLSDGTATVTAVGGSGGFIYTWNDALSQNTASATNLDAGTYQVVVTDVNGCVDSATVNIEEPDSLILTLLGVTDVLCNGASTGAVSVNTAGGTTAYSYQWTNGGGSNEDLSGASAGTYTLTVTDANNCTDQLTATIAEPAALSINLVGTDILCSGGADGEIDATVNGGVIPYTYAWTGPNGYTNNTEDVTGLTGGTYTLSVTDSNNCILTQTITINEPTDVVITFSDSPVNCFGGNDGSLTASVVSGGTAPFSFQWDAAANNQLTATATGLTAGTYTVTVTDANGCVYTSSASVTEPQAPLSILMDSTNISCAGYNDGTGTASVSGGTPGYSYLWNDPQAQTTATATDLPSGNFQVTVTDANGCVITGSVNIEAPNAINISAVSDSTNCFGEATGGISVVASGGTGIGFAYSIDGGETFQSSPDFFNLPAGIYDEIIVQDLGSNIACLSPLTSATVYEQPYFTFEVVPGDTTLQLEESVNLSLNVTSPNYTNSDIAQVSWFPSTGLNCTDCVNPTVLTYDSYTEYTATVYYYGDDNELCNAVASTIIIVENNLALYIPNAFTPSNYDNVNNRFEVYGEGIEYVTMQVYNRIGEKIFESSNQQVGWDGTYKGELQNPGVYTYYVSVEYLDGKVIDRKGSVTLIR
jgi:gliding motility-associated-like protein